MAKKADNCQNNFLSNSKYMVRKNNAISILLTNETGQWNLSPLTPESSGRFFNKLYLYHLVWMVQM